MSDKYFLHYIDEVKQAGKNPIVIKLYHNIIGQIDPLVEKDIHIIKELQRLYTLDETTFKELENYVRSNRDLEEYVREDIDEIEKLRIMDGYLDIVVKEAQHIQQEDMVKQWMHRQGGRRKRKHRRKNKRTRKRKHNKHNKHKKSKRKLK